MYFGRNKNMMVEKYITVYFYKTALFNANRFTIDTDHFENSLWSLVSEGGGPNFFVNIEKFLTSVPKTQTKYPLEFVF